MKCSNTCLHENVLQFFNMHIVMIRENMFLWKMYLKNTIYIYIKCPKSFQLNVYNIKKLKAPLYNEQIELQLLHVRAGIVHCQCTKNAFLYHCAHILDMTEMKYKSSLFIIWALAYHGILNIGPVTNSYQQIQTLSVWLAFTAWNIWVHRNIICHQSLKSIWLKLLQQVITERLCLHNTIFLTNDPNQSTASVIATGCQILN